MLQRFAQIRTDPAKYLLTKLIGDVTTQVFPQNGVLGLQELPVDSGQCIGAQTGVGLINYATVANTHGQIATAQVDLSFALRRLFR